ncbi:uncharacterized protein B0P05DRAFT_560637 [Gilbertella persicaria]|uniref:uncharacterized protein n=1 Tax=Gilbertella persicaria TaxID=101096 RepID=UPI00221FE765|nr:uncharacterized protein B0P05DRAFT_560637 [Gilbertella persicaria]KAI8055591.1 hypothetical protein B0P05DRAFT_560637 [Gilbertella persicaria]
MYYPSLQNTPEDEFIDERWDVNLGPTEPSKHQRLEALLQNFSIRQSLDHALKETISPPSSKDKHADIHTGYFKEDMFFDQESSEPDSPATKLEQTIVTPISSTSIPAIEEATPDESVYIPLQQEPSSRKPPVTLEMYHSDLVQHYIRIIVEKAQTMHLDHLPENYRLYIQALKDMPI